MLLSKNEVMRNKIKHNKIKCIYFLIKEETVVYVGQTTDLHFRLSQHSRHKDFDSYYYEECNQYELDELELKYIVKFDPILNAKLPENDFYRTLDGITRNFPLNKRDLNRKIKEQSIKPFFRNFYDVRDFGLTV